MIDKVRSFIKEYNMFEAGDRVVVGVSGGADSVALLKVLLLFKEELALSVFVVHIDHGIRLEAGEDADYVKSLCEESDVPFFLFRENIPKMAAEAKCSEEEMGRIYRYKCFRKVLVEQNACKLAVAHHMDDQAETVLFHMIRGTDLAGLGGMRPVSGDIVRPLLCLRKKEIIDWLVKQGISWREDVTNSDDSYSRNRIRVNVVPELEKVNERSVEHIAELATKINEYDAYIEKQAHEYITKYKIDSENGIGIDRKHLLEQDKILADRVLYELLTNVCGAKKDVTKDHIGELYELMKKSSGRRVNLPYGVTAFNSYDMLYIEKGKVDDERNADRQWSVTVEINELILKGRMEFVIPSGGKAVFTVTNRENDTDYANSEILQKNYTKYFDCDTIGDTLQIRYPDKEDYVVVDMEEHRKKIGRFYKDAKLPANLRGALPVLAVGKEILWLFGVRRFESSKILENTKRILVVEYVKVQED